MDSHIQLRRCILKNLYHHFREYPYASIELSQLAGECNAQPKELNWNIVYLEKSGFLELDRQATCQPFISCLATITAKGIDLIENKNLFNRRFNLPNG